MDGGDAEWKIRVSLSAFGDREPVRLGNFINASCARELEWKFGTRWGHDRESIRRRPSPCPRALRARRDYISNSVFVQNSQWLEFNGPRTDESPEGWNRRPRRRGGDGLVAFHLHNELALHTRLHGGIRDWRTRLSYFSGATRRGGIFSRGSADVALRAGIE